MSEHSDFLGDGGIIEWEREVRGYNRQQVDEVVARQTGAIRDLKNSLSQCLAEIERLRDELAEARESSARRPHEEVSERVGQILKLADDEAKVMRDRGSADAAALRDATKAETDKLRADTKQETDRIRAEAQDRAERMLAAAAEQSERTVASAKAEASEMISRSQASAEQTVAQANAHAESTVAAAMAQAKQQLDDATARATAIHDGSERRLNLLISRHTETVRRLTEIRDVVTSLVAGEAARGSLEDEVDRALSAQAAGGPDGRAASQHEQPGGGAHRVRADQPAQGVRQSGQAQPAHGHPGHGQPGHRQPSGPGGQPVVHAQSPAVPDPGAPVTEDLEEADSLSDTLTDSLTADQHEGAPLQARPVDTRKRSSRLLDEAGAGTHRTIDG